MTYTPKIVVFDLDETLGYFQEFGMFWNCLTQYICHENININEITQDVFNSILDLYPEFLRPDIITILTYLKKKKKQGYCNHVMIYTNNQAPKEWTEMIQRYFDKKIHFVLFDQIIGAFKINGKVTEICRTSHTKNIQDFICCTRLPEGTQICFVDDVLHSGMICDNVYYVNIKPYTCDLPLDVIVDRFLNSKIMHQVINNDAYFKQFVFTIFHKYNYKISIKTEADMNIDKILSKKILDHLHTFFKMYFPVTCKKNQNSNKTRKLT